MKRPKNNESRLVKSISKGEVGAHRNLLQHILFRQSIAFYNVLIIALPWKSRK